MRMRVEGAGGGDDWALAVQPGATLGDLLRAVGEGPARGAAVDGRDWPASTPLETTGLGEGSTVDIRGAAPQVPTPAEAVVLRGPDAGRRIALPAGRTVIGRRGGGVQLADPALSGRHAAIDVGPDGAVRVTDLGSTNGTGGPPGELRVGTSLLCIGPRCAGPLCARPGISPATPAGPTRRPGPHHRPPRVPGPGAVDPVEPPVTPVEPERPRLGVATLAVPLATGAVLAALYGPQLAIVAVIGPLVALGGWLAARSSVERAGRRLHREHSRALAELRREAAARRDAEAARRRTASPDLVDLVDRARRHDPALWERRPGHDDFLVLAVGPGDLDWAVPTSRAPDAAAQAVLAESAHLPSVPVTVDGRGLVGVCGPRPFTTAIARALTAQVVTLHGPADVHVAVLTSDASAADWEWTRWLPHLADPSDASRRVLASGRDAASDLAAAMQHDAATTDGPHRWLVVDGDDVELARWGAVRGLLAPRASRASSDHGEPGASGIVVATHAAHLPATCSAIVHVDERGNVRLRSLDAPSADRHAELVGLGTATAELLARELAPLIDPEMRGGVAELADRCDLLELLAAGDDHAPVTADGIRSRWSLTAGTDHLVGPLGVDARGVVDVDLVHDGPHVLVAGTTGSGKSELLRSLVASLAASADTDHCNLVLIDFKGGAAFDRLTALPHVVGSVTDLDEHLAARALRCLESELRRREHVLRIAGASDVTSYVRARRDRTELEPLPRLVVVVDEFATLVAELPDFVDALVDMAQRGRSLGVHLVLATQRPAGAVKDSIRTNTNLRIALRVVEPADSRDVVACDDAARLPRHRPGRAVLRSGASEPLTFQAAHISGPCRRRRPAPVEAARWRPNPTAPPAAPASDDRSPTALDRLVDAIDAAHRSSGRLAPRRPWPDPLPDSICLGQLGSCSSATAAFALADQPEQQRLAPFAWEPRTGNLLVAGLAGSGVTTTLGTIAVALAGSRAPASLHLYVVGSDVPALGPLEQLPHCGAVVSGDDLERTVRLLRRLDDELRQRRRTGPAEVPTVVTIVDGVSALRAELDAAGLLDEIDLLERLAADGPGVGLVFAFGAEHPNSVGHRIDRTIAERLLLRLPDRADYIHAGLHGVDPRSMVPGRGFLGSGVEVQVARHDADAIAEISGRHGAPTIGRARPFNVGRLADVAHLADLPIRASIDEDALTLPVGLGERRLDVVGFALRSGDHLLVTGPARAGKTTALRTITAALRRDARIDVVDIGSDRRCAERPTVAALHELAARVLASSIPTVVIVDDADLLDDGGALLPLVQPGRAGLHVVAAGRADRLRSLFRHWTNEVRRSHLALLLRGDELDGDLVGVRVPRRPPAPWRPGRAWLVSDDHIELCQIALPDDPQHRRRPEPEPEPPTQSTNRETDQCA
jgi:S-DNA-T family DNA segregation ATPase FtsK/SpoIIIE